MRNPDLALLQITERLAENLSSSQIASTLDELILRALSPLVGFNLLETVLVEILPFTATNARRKFSALSQNDFVDKLFSVIVVDNKKQKLQLLREIRMERTLYFTTLSMFEERTKFLPKLMTEYIGLNLKHIRAVSDSYKKLMDIADAVNVPLGKLYQVRQESIYWYSLAVQFKQMISEKFVRLAYVEAQKAAKSTGLDVNVSDLFRDLMISSSKAIDKYDSTKGPLTSYVMWWFMDAKTQHNNSHEYGIAYRVPVAQRRRLLEGGAAMNNLVVELSDNLTSELVDDDASVLDSLIKAQDALTIQAIVAKLPEARFSNLLDGFHYPLTSADKALLAATKT